MKSFLRAIRAIVLWSYSRKTWQYDVLCALILAFIFLTPKSWFETSEPTHTPAHQSRVASVLLVDQQTLSAQPDKAEIERRVRLLTDRPETQVTNVRAVRDAAGRTIAYEVDIR
jgi:hypothetical protein